MVRAALGPLSGVMSLSPSFRRTECAMPWSWWPGPISATLRRAERFEHHEIQREQLSTRERMSEVLERLKGGNFTAFRALFDAEEGRLGVVVTFLAILELVKEQLIDIVQQETLGLIHVRAREERTAEGPSYREFENNDDGNRGEVE